MLNSGKYLIILCLLFIFSCTKTEIIKGRYYGLATGYYMGVNVNSLVEVVRVDDEKVDLNCDFNGYQELYTNVSVFKGNDQKYYLTDGINMQAVIDDSQMYFQYEDTGNFQNNIVFSGTK